MWNNPDHNQNAGDITGNILEPKTREKSNRCPKDINLKKNNKLGIYFEKLLKTVQIQSFLKCN